MVSLCHNKIQADKNVCVHLLFVCVYLRVCICISVCLCLCVHVYVFEVQMITHSSMLWWFDLVIFNLIMIQKW